jgi:hypothetical protein
VSTGESFTFLTSEIFTVESQDADHPIYMASYMTGSTFPEEGGIAGDPDFVNVVPAEQYLDDYRFFVDFTYPDSVLTLVRRRDRSGFHDVDLDCAGVVASWTPIEADPDFEYAWVDMTANTSPVGACGYGAHHVQSDGPFAATLWGWGETASYGFPAGAGSRPLSSVNVSVR